MRYVPPGSCPIHAVPTHVKHAHSVPRTQDRSLPRVPCFHFLLSPCGKFTDFCNGHLLCDGLHVRLHVTLHNVSALQMADDVETFQPETLLLGTSPVAFVDAGAHTTLMIQSSFSSSCLCCRSCVFLAVSKCHLCTHFNQPHNASDLFIPPTQRQPRV